MTNLGKIDLQNKMFYFKSKIMEDKDKIIALLRKQLKDSESKCNALEQELELIKAHPEILEKEEFNIPDFGTNEWANWMIEINKKR